MNAYARLLLPDGTIAVVAPGDLVGRLRSAALHLRDARISEAHALVSLRGHELKLLALRGRFAVDGRVQTEVALLDGLVVELAPGLSVEVIDVVVPDAVLALEGDGLPRQILSGVCSVELAPQLRLVPRYVGEAAAHVWSDGPEWTLRVGSEPPRPLVAGDTFAVGGHRLRAVQVSLLGAARAATQLDGLRSPLRIEANFDSVQILRADQPTFALGGIGARIVSELVACAGPLQWRVLAGEIWKDEVDTDLLRTRWDVALSRLRRKLRDARLPPDLVRADHSGCVELVLEPGDVVVDRT